MSKLDWSKKLVLDAMADPELMKKFWSEEFLIVPDEDLVISGNTCSATFHLNRTVEVTVFLDDTLERLEHLFGIELRKSVAMIRARHATALDYV
ncbi:hypothetical protein NVP1081O_093 [Vibrio phage 1.081.O._10N.286.52.C2]|nr:hypothetical protein NVP1081O_093 [Vibrio phage 1.081.O._10N.286.52.C2]